MTKVYRYGLLPPTAGREVIDRQCDLAWRSAIARLRAYEAHRERVNVVMRAEAPQVAELALVREQIASVRAELKLHKSGRHLPKTPEVIALRAQLSALVSQAKALAPLAKEKRADLWKTSGALARLSEALKSEYLRLARAFSEAGLFWGTRQLVEASHDQRIKTAKGSLRYPVSWGAVGIQIAGGMPVSDGLDDPRLAITAEAQPIPGRSGKPRPRLRLRIAPGDVCAEWPIIMHRPLPSDGSIRFAKVTATRIGRQVRWEAHLTVTMPDPMPVPMSSRIVAVRPTFTRVGDALVVAESADLAGELEPYALHPRIAGAMSRSHGLRAVRDKSRDDLLGRFVQWKADGRPLPAMWPREIARWESCDRLRQFILGPWTRQRADGDDDLYYFALAWAKHDAHLWDWDRHMVSSALARRLHLYRRYAHGLVQQYDVLVVPDTDYRVVAVRGAKPERDETALSVEASRQRMLGAPGELRRCLVQAFVSAGKTVLEAGGASPMELLSNRPDKPKDPKRRKPKFAKRHKASASAEESAEMFVAREESVA